MKKRILLVLLAVVCILSFAACKKDTPQSLFENAEKAMADLKGYEAKVTVTTKTSYGEGEDDEEPEKIEMALKVNGNNMEMTVEDETVLYVDGFMYMDMGEMGKYKIEMSLEDLQENIGMTTDASNLPKLNEDILKDVELVEEGDLRSFTVALDEATIKDYMGSALDGMLEEDMDVAFSNMSFTASFDKDDNLVKMGVKYDMAMDLGELLGEMSMSMETVIEFVNLGTVPTVSAPSDAAEYEEMDMDDMFG